MWTWSGVGTWTSNSLTLLLPCLRQVHNVAFAFELMLDGGLKKPKARPEGNTPPEQFRAQREGQQEPGPQATCVSMGSRRFFPLHVWQRSFQLLEVCPLRPTVCLFSSADVVNLDLKSTLRVLYTLFTKYKDVE